MLVTGGTSGIGAAIGAAFSGCGADVVVTGRQAASVAGYNAEAPPRCHAEPLDVAEAARPLLARQGGAIVNIASVLSFVGGAHAPGYAASKGGVVQLTKSLAIAYAAQGIRVNAIAPGWVETRFTRAVLADAARAAAIVARTPLGRWGQPEDIAGAAVFLCSPAAAFITGAVLAVDGGYLAN